MSWQTYVDDHLMSEITPGHSLTAAAIVGHDGSVWAQSAKFPEVKPEEHAAILEGFDEGSALAKLGFSLGGDKYSVVQGEPGIVIRGKKTKGGITIRKTGTALVIGIYDEPTTAAECNVAVERLGDYLAEQGI